MEKFSHHFLHFSVLVATFLVTTSRCQLQNLLPKIHTAIFIFGDSLFDSGNNNYVPNAGKANFFPYGQTYFKFATGRFTDGRVIPDFIAGYLNLPFIQPYKWSLTQTPTNRNYTNGVNFASGGAGALVDTFKGTTISLKAQVGYFKKVRTQLRVKLGAKEANKLLSNAIFLFSIGINDYSRQFSSNSSFSSFHSKQDYVKMVISNVTSVFQEIYEKGGRKFAIANVAPLGCLPNMRAKNNGECINEAIEIVKMHNKALDFVLKSLKFELQDFNYVLFSLFDSLAERIINPSLYGLKEVKAACCGSGPYRGKGNCGGKGKLKDYELCEDPNKYLFFDGHPTEIANFQCAQLLWSGKNKRFTRPYNLKQLSQLQVNKFNI